MRKARLIRSSFLAVVGLAMAACASGGGGGGGTEGAAPEAAGENNVVLHITNDLAPPANVTIFVVPEDGAPRRLGTMPPNAQQNFNFSPSIRAMPHRIRADVVGGGNRNSDMFILTNVTDVTWSLSNSIVRCQPGNCRGDDQ